ncbi:hypothetical protein [Paenibacillus campinasensis]|uniref:Uncharacterized protein n=1 Tax=Paenibacillus campinasensis TaxID=66347 RepID=A0A268ELG0_9BACL|nr:hypothetical protein [Paenibacillus campinasensis]PAD73959.1 hypothetical protein CHH67_19190 [Paenibacillus campinasensis]
MDNQNKKNWQAYPPAQLIVGAMGMLVDDYGMTPREVFELIEAIKRDTWHGLAEMHAENKKGGRVQ